MRAHEAAHVVGDVQEHRPRPPAHGLAEGRGEVVWDAVDSEDRSRPLGDRAHDLDLVHILHGAQVAVGDARTAADDHDRRPGLMSDGHPREGVDHARASGYHGHGRSAGVAGPPFGHESTSGAARPGGSRCWGAFRKRARIPALVGRGDPEGGRGQPLAGRTGSGRVRRWPACAGTACFTCRRLGMPQ